MPTKLDSKVTYLCDCGCGQKVVMDLVATDYNDHRPRGWFELLQYSEGSDKDPSIGAGVRWFSCLDCLRSFIDKLKKLPSEKERLRLIEEKKHNEALMRAYGPNDPRARRGYWQS